MTFQTHKRKGFQLTTTKKKMEKGFETPLLWINNKWKIKKLKMQCLGAFEVYLLPMYNCGL